MNDQVQVVQKQPFCWVLNSSVEAILTQLPETRRCKAMALLMTISYCASRERDGQHRGFIRSVPELAKAVGESRSTVYRLVGELEKISVIQRIERRDEQGGSLSPAWVLTDPGGCLTHETPGVPESASDLGHPNARTRETKKNNNLSLSACAPSERPAVEPRRVRIHRKEVPVELVGRARDVLEHYCERTGRRLRPFTAAGEPAECLKRIVGRIVEEPDRDVPELCGIVDRVLANPPGWCDGRTPEVGDIFGPNAWARAVCNDGQRSAKTQNGKIAQALLRTEASRAS